MATAALLLPLGACSDSSGDSSTQVTPVSNTTTSEKAPSATVEKAPATESPKASKSPKADASQLARAGSAADISRAGSAMREPAEKPDYGPQIVFAEPMELDLGQIPTGDTGKGKVRLKNTGDEAVTLNRCQTSCGCTTTNCPTNQAIDPGSEVEVEVSMKGGTRAASLSKTVTFHVEGQEPVRVRVKAEAISYVTIEPEIMNADVDPETVVTLKAIDGEPFKVTSVYPPMFEALSDEPAEEVKLTVNWDMWREKGASRKMVFYVDHPKCTQVQARVQSKQPVTSPSARKALTDGGTRDLGTARPSAQPRQAPKLTPVNLLKQGKIDEVKQRLADGDVDLQETDRAGASLLALAARYGDAELVQSLVDMGADINSLDNRGQTPLMAGAHSKNVRNIQILLDAGAKVNTVDQIGCTALSWAAGFGDAATVEELIAAGANIDVNGGLTGFTPLIWAAGFGEAGSVERLVEAGSDVNAKDLAQGCTPIMHAARTGRTDNVKILIDADADLESRDNTGKTALLLAAEASGSTKETIQALIEAGSKLDAVENRGLTALDLARKRTDPRAAEVIMVLEEHMGEGE